MRPGVFVCGVFGSAPRVPVGAGVVGGQAGNAGAGLQGLKDGRRLRQGQADGAGGVFDVPAQDQMPEQGAFKRGKLECLRAGMCHGPSITHRRGGHEAESHRPGVIEVTRADS